MLYEKLNFAVFICQQQGCGSASLALNADPDRSSFSLYRTTHPERDPAFHLNADPDLFLIKVMRIRDKWSIDIPGLHFEPPGLHCECPRLYFEPLKPDLDPDPASKINTDQDQQNCQLCINYRTS